MYNPYHPNTPSPLTQTKPKSQAQHAAFSADELLNRSQSAIPPLQLKKDGRKNPPARATVVIPRENHKANKNPYEDANDDEPIIIHSQKHNDIRDRKLHRMDDRADDLLPEGEHMAGRRTSYILLGIIPQQEVERPIVAVNF